MDDFDFEITNLRDQPAKKNAITSNPTDHTGHDTSESAQSNVRSPVGKHLSRHPRLLRSLAIVTPIFLVLALILGANTTIHAAFDSLLHPVTTFANSTAPGAEQFDLAHVAPWGDLRIDGQIVPHNQVLQRFRAIKLDPGSHTLDYNAPPFAPLYCTLTVPADPTSDTCPLTQTADDLYMIGNDTVRMLDLRAGFTNLSSQQLATLTNAAAAGLLAASPTATVAPGEHYLTPTGDVAVNRSRPMQATFLYQLNTDPPHDLPDFPPLQCSPLCFYTHLFEQAPSEWGVIAPVTLSWSYVVPHSIIYGPITPDHDTLDAGIPLHITWQHGWRITPLPYTSGPFGNPICVPAQDALDRAPARISAMSGFSSSMRPAPAANGCLIQWSPVTSATNNYIPPSRLLYRFGVLLAANDQAHRTFPTLPLASASEQSLAQQLAAQG